MARHRRRGMSALGRVLVGRGQGGRKIELTKGSECSRLKSAYFMVLY